MRGESEPLDGASGRLALEADIGSLRERGDLREAVNRTVVGYGPEVLGFLATWLGDQDLAAEAFSQACEELWKTFDRFEGRSSIRTWFYVLARRAASAVRRSPHRKRERRASLSEANEVAERVRSATLSHLRTAARDRVLALREELSEDDRALLVLRIDRDMSWMEVARILAPEEQSADAQVRASARLRKRFQAVKDEIRTRARERGLL